jgi:SnoaL-like domain
VLRQPQSSTGKAKELVLSLARALNAEDFQAARDYLADNLTFVGVFGSHEGAEPFIQDMERLRLKFDVARLFGDGEDICMFYNLTASGVTLFASGWFQVREGKVSSVRIVFDPRPLLASPTARD